MRQINYYFILLFLLVLLFSCKQETYYTITTLIQPTDGGEIVVTPSSNTVLEGTSVTFTAQPKGDYIFSGWSGSLSGTDNPKTVTASSDINVTATFTLRQYPLILSTEGEGTISERVISTKTDYASGTVVELTAIAADHWVFDHWEGDMSGLKNPAQITISTAKSVKAVFVEKMYGLSIVVQGEGTVKESVIQTKSTYQEGTVVELTAQAAEFWAFDHWEGDLTGTDNPAPITISSAASVKAVFIEHDPGIVFTETEYISPYDINRRLGLGWCFGCQMDSFRIGDTVQAGEEYWDNPKCTQQLFDAAAKAGINSVRIQICWLGRVGPAPDYIIDESWLNRVAEVVGYAEKAGMNVIINMQNDDRTNFWGDDEWTLLELAHREEFWLDPERASKDPELNKEINRRVYAMWTQIARRFRDKGDFLMFESMNEPGSTFFWSWASDAEKDAHQGEFDCLNEWNQTFVDAVRSTGGNNASRWLVVVGAAAKERNFDRLVIPQDYVSNNRIMVSLHFYEPESYCQGDTRQWGHTAYALNEDAMRFDEKYVADAFKNYKEKYMDNGIPLCVNEIGAKNRDKEDDKLLHLYYLEYVTRAATLNKMAVFIYDQGGNDPHYNSFAIFNHATGDYLAYGEELMRTVYRAATSTDSEYDLNFIYNNAPRLYPQDSVIIPDPGFFAFLLENYDFDKNGSLTTNELVRVQNLRVPSSGIRSLSGLAYFPYLTTLDCGWNELPALDVSSNPHLEYLNCEHNPHLNSLDVSMLPNLKYLNAQDCIISELDVSNNPLLIQFQVNGNPLNRVPDLTNNPYLEQIHINEAAGAYYIESDFFVSFPRVTGISIGGYPRETIDLSKNTLLESIWAHSMPNMEVLDLSASPRLKYLFVPNSRKLKIVYVHPDVDISLLTVVKDSDSSLQIRNKQ